MVLLMFYLYIIYFAFCLYLHLYLVFFFFFFFLFSAVMFAMYCIVYIGMGHCVQTLESY